MSKTIPRSIFASVVPIFAVISGFSQAPSMTPTIEREASDDRTPQTIRSARAAYANKFTADTTPFERRDPRTPPVGIFHTPAPKSELPQDLADTIIVGKIAEIQAYLSKNRGAIYTESTIAIEEIISSKQSLMVGDNIALVQDGGAIRLRIGSVFTQKVYGSGNELQEGGEYLFFLRSLNSLNAYGCSKAWSLSNGTVAAVSSDDLARVANHSSTYQGMAVSEFLQVARALKASLAYQ